MIQVTSNEDALLCLAALTRFGRQHRALIASLAIDTTVRTESDVETLISAISGVSDAATALIIARLGQEISSSDDFQSFPVRDRVNILRALHRLDQLEIVFPKSPISDICDFPPCEQLACLSDTGQLLVDRKFLGDILNRIKEINTPSLSEISMVLSSIHVRRVRSEISDWLLRHLEGCVQILPVMVFALAAKFIGEQRLNSEKAESAVFARLSEYPSELSVRELERYVFRVFDFRKRSEIFRKLISGKNCQGAGLGMLCAARESCTEISGVSVPQVDVDKVNADFLARLLLAGGEEGLDVGQLSEAVRLRWSELSETSKIRLSLAGIEGLGDRETDVVNIAKAFGKGERETAELAMIDLVNKWKDDSDLRFRVNILLRELLEDSESLREYDVFSLARELVL